MRPRGPFPGTEFGPGHTIRTTLGRSSGRSSARPEGGANWISVGEFRETIRTAIRQFCCNGVNAAEGHFMGLSTASALSPAGQGPSHSRPNASRPAANTAFTATATLGTGSAISLMRARRLCPIPACRRSGTPVPLGLRGGCGSNAFDLHRGRSMHGAMLALDKGEALLAQAQAGDVPEAGAKKFAYRFAQKRAETDSRVAMTKEIDEGELFKAQLTGFKATRIRRTATLARPSSPEGQAAWAARNLRPRGSRDAGARRRRSGKPSGGCEACKNFLRRPCHEDSLPACQSALSRVLMSTPCLLAAPRQRTTYSCHFSKV